MTPTELCQNPTPRTCTTHAQERMEALRLRHRRRELLHTLEEIDGPCSPRRLLSAARDRGLDPLLSDCRELLDEVQPGHPPDLPTRAKPAGLRETLIVAAKSFGRPFTLSELVIAAWKLAPELFCLPGHPEHPSDHKVTAALYGQRGLRARGDLIQEGDRYRAAE